MKDKRDVLYLRIKTDSSEWLTKHAKKLGISKNSVVQMLINREMEKEREARRDYGE